MILVLEVTRSVALLRAVYRCLRTLTKHGNTRNEWAVSPKRDRQPVPPGTEELKPEKPGELKSSLMGAVQPRRRPRWLGAEILSVLRTC
eukprot:495846-Amorphochlora_amoeboformis.AAC.2